VNLDPFLDLSLHLPLYLDPMHLTDTLVVLLQRQTELSVPDQISLFAVGTLASNCREIRVPPLLLLRR
jgi:hypothetical protein